MEVTTHKTINRWFFLALTGLPMLACSHREMIPTSELKEIRRLAFDEATKRYVRSEASVETEYKARLNSQLEDARSEQEQAELEAKTSKRHAGEPPERVPHFDILTATKKRGATMSIPAVAGVKGLRLTPLTPQLCSITFDFQASASPHAESPENAATAERFERADGSHYWVVVWK